MTSDLVHHVAETRRRRPLRTHATEAKAEKHAEELVKSGKAKVATYFEANQLEESA